MERAIFKAVIVGAGPAALTAAYELSKQHAPVVVLESAPQYVGGISRTVNYKDFRFDIDGHRFFSKSREVEDFWTEIAGENMLDHPRSSRIYYRRRAAINESTQRIDSIKPSFERASNGFKG
jgi:protoporphyrinogen oxidase